MAVQNSLFKFSFHTQALSKLKRGAICFVVVVHVGLDMLAICLTGIGDKLPSNSSTLTFIFSKQIYINMNARVCAREEPRPVNSLLLIFCLIVTSKIWDGAAPFKRYERHTNAFVQCFLMKHGVPYKLERYSI